MHASMHSTQVIRKLAQIKQMKGEQSKLGSRKEYAAKPEISQPEFFTFEDIPDFLFLSFLWPNLDNVEKTNCICSLAPASFFTHIFGIKNLI